MENQVWQIGEDLIGRLRFDVAKYQESGNIFQKLETNGQLGKIYSVFFDLMKDEFAFTMSELVKFNNEAANDGQEFDIMGKYQQNSLIFKSNLQLISASVLDYVWMLFFNHAKQVLNEKGKTQGNTQNQQIVQQDQKIEEVNKPVEQTVPQDNTQLSLDKQENTIPNVVDNKTQEQESKENHDFQNLTALRQRKQSSNEILLDERTNHKAHEQIEVHQKQQEINEQIILEQDISIQNQKGQVQGISDAAESQLKEKNIDLVTFEDNSQKQQENCEGVEESQEKIEIGQKNEIVSKNNNQQKIEQQEDTLNVNNIQTSGIVDNQVNSLRTSYEQQIYRNTMLSAGKTQDKLNVSQSQQSFQSPHKKEVSGLIESNSSSGRQLHHHKPSNSEVTYLSPDRVKLKTGMSVDNLRRNMETISMNWPNLGVTKIPNSQVNQGDNSSHNITAQSGTFSENKSSLYQKGTAILNSPIETSVASLARLLSGSKGFK